MAQWALADVFHVPGGGFGLLAVGGGIWWLSRPAKAPAFQSPASVQGWLKRCDAVLDQFDALEELAGTAASRDQRQRALDQVVERSGPLTVAVVGSEGVALPESQALQQALSGRHALNLCVGHPLSSVSDSWAWPLTIQ